jgi:RNA polymerase sigma-70 factor, ECF subfamily
VARRDRLPPPGAGSLSGDRGSQIGAWVRAIQRGEDAEGGARRLDRLYRPRIFKFFRRRGLPHEEARDLTQDSLMRVFKGIDDYRFDASFDTWLFHIVKNVWRNDHRAKTTAKRAATEVPLAPSEGAGGEISTDEAGALATDEPSPEETILAGERDRAVDAQVALLPERMRRCVQLRFGQGLKYHEIATVLQVKIDTVKSQLHHANQRLRPLLGNLVDPDGPEA